MRLDQAMGVFSHGEQIMVFGLIDAVQTLGRDDLAVIIGWAKDPFFP